MEAGEGLAVWVELVRAGGALGAAIERALSGHGLRGAEVVLLRQVADQPGLRRVELAAALGMSASGVSRALAPLEAAGLVESTREARDARASRTALTAAGWERLSVAEAAAGAAAAGLLSARIYPDEVATLRRLLARLSR